MKEITLLFTPAELRELAKQLYLASYFCAGCDYDNQPMVDEIMTRVCATGFAEAPETKGFRHGGFGEPIFFVSNDVDEECTPLVELYEDYAIKEYLPYMLADRDFLEQYGTLDDEKVLCDPTLLAALESIQKKYLDEFERYGVIHLRLGENE